MLNITPITDISAFVKLDLLNEDLETGYKGVYTHPRTNELIPVVVKLAMEPKYTMTDVFKWMDEWERVRRRILELHTYPHPSIPSVLGIYSEGDFVFVVYRLYSKGEVLPYLRGNSKISALDMVTKIAKTLEHLHKHEITCGEPTPPHILVGDDGEPILTCIRLPPYHPALCKEKSRPYSAPEMWRNIEQSAQIETLRYNAGWASFETDVYAFSLTAIHLLSGKFPVAKDTKKRISDTNPVVREEHPSISEELWPTLEACWNEFGFRRPTMAHVVEALEAVSSK